MEKITNRVLRRELHAGLFKKGSRVVVDLEENECHGQLGTVMSVKDKAHNANIVAVDGSEDIARVFLDPELDEPRKPCKRG